jgi:hypothetical protein
MAYSSQHCVARFSLVDLSGCHCLWSQPLKLVLRGLNTMTWSCLKTVQIMKSCAVYCNVLNLYGKLLMSWRPKLLVGCLRPLAHYFLNSPASLFSRYNEVTNKNKL